MILNITDRKKQLKIYLRQSISNAIFHIKFPFKTCYIRLMKYVTKCLLWRYNFYVIFNYDVTVEVKHRVLHCLYLNNKMLSLVF
jgi:hypothetical protein